MLKNTSEKTWAITAIKTGLKWITTAQMAEWYGASVS